MNNIINLNKEVVDYNPSKKSSLVSTGRGCCDDNVNSSNDPYRLTKDQYEAIKYADAPKAANPFVTDKEFDELRRKIDAVLNSGSGSQKHIKIRSSDLQSDKITYLSPQINSVDFVLIMTGIGLLIEGIHYTVINESTKGFKLLGALKLGDKDVISLLGPISGSGGSGDGDVIFVEGPKGEKGEAGPPGRDGTGVTIKGSLANISLLPVTGNKANDAYLIDGDLYVWDGLFFNNVGRIQGPKGDKGDKGEKGDIGAKGEKGDIGLTGRPGVDGKDGTKGDKGDRGEKGDKGDRGFQGDKGVSGDKGEKGDKGDTGPAGPKQDPTKAGPGLTYNSNNELTLDTVSTVLVSPTISAEWTLFKADGTAYTPPTSNSKSLVVDKGVKANLNATYRYPGAIAGQGLPTSVSGNFGTTLPAIGIPSTPLVVNSVTTNATYEVILFKPKSGLIVENSQVVLPKGNEQKSDSISIFFRSKAYLGYSTNKVLTPSQVLSLANATFATGKARTVNNVTAPAEYYTYIAYESSFGDLANVIMDGAAPVKDAFTKLSDVTITNEAGVPITMRIYRSNGTQAFTNNTLALT